MAESAVKYARKATYGNLAYDYGGAKTAPRYLPEESSAPAREFPREDTRTAARARTKAAEVPAVAPFSIIGFLCAAAVLVFVLLGYVQLTQLSAEAGGYQSQRDGLKDQQARLMIEYESTFNLMEVEEYATDVLGMVRANNSQVYYIDGAGADKSVIIANGAEEDTMAFWDNITGFFSTIVEYFR